MNLIVEKEPFSKNIFFQKKWFEHGGVPSGFKMWVPISKK